MTRRLCNWIAIFAGSIAMWFGAMLFFWRIWL